MAGTGRPLEGLKVVVTRRREQAAGFVAALERLGARVTVFPAIRIVPPEDPEPLRRAVRTLGYEWIVFTSANGVERFWEELVAAGAAGPPAGVRFACVGPSTAAALASRGIDADVVPGAYVAEAIADALVAAHVGPPGTRGRGRPLEGVRILLPLAAGAGPALAAGLAERGASVERVDAYRTVPDTAGAEDLRRFLEGGGVDVVTFMSASAAESFVAAVGARLGRVAVAAIGPATADAARELGLTVDVVAEEHTAAGLVAALVRRFGRERGAGPGV